MSGKDNRLLSPTIRTLTGSRERRQFAYSLTSTETGPGHRTVLYCFGLGQRGTMAAPTRQVFKRRDTITTLPLYYSGHLLKKYTGEKDFKNFFGELRGSTIFLYTDEINDTYSEKLDLQTLKSMTMDSAYKQQMPTIYTLTLSKEEVQLKMDNPDTGEEWRGFIITVATKEIPSKLQLLPGQMLRLHEVLLEEQKRLAFCPPTSHHINLTSATSPTDVYDDLLSGAPLCFFSVSRQEAEKMLMENQGYGNIILRPSSDVHYAITLRQDQPSGSVMKNYKVLSTNTGFVIELNSPVTVPSLAAAVDHILKVTDFRLTPYQVPQAYDTCIDLASTLPCSSSKTITRARVAPIIQTRSPTGDTSLSNPIPPTPLESKEAGNKYQEADLRPGNLDQELQTVLQSRRKKIDIVVSI
ncbi:hypothetical protein DPEC_G00027760 [Dallia pectoralis]|uniref:Uncharacterized protein n=1 Tax=Dallia pectoralis TaxID=75939 RepID=A0ACC2HIM6_DALPE|nr:hypothetical protein DPEC_G00027760 [Dallia pectoralis]